MRGKGDSIQLLALHQTEVYSLLIENIRVATELSVEPLLDLLVQLSRDLQSDFYARFPETLEVDYVLLGWWSNFDRP